MKKQYALYALRTERWVIWNRSDWSKGWISLEFLDLQTVGTKRRRIYSGIGFNGERFASCDALAKMPEGEAAKLLEFLKSRMREPS